MTALRRRTLLAGSAATVLLTASGCSLLPPIPKRPQPTLAHAIGWLRLDDAGRVELFCPRMEMGQGIHAALRSLVTGELGLPPSAVRVRHPSTADIAPAKATVGSDSVRELAPLLRQACALLRERLPRTASAAAAGDADPALLALVTGRPSFAADVRLPGLRHACVLRSPWRRETGSMLLGLDDAALQRVSGFLRRIDLPQLDGPALVADHPGALQALRDAARARWSEPPGLPDATAAVDVDRALAAGRLTKDHGRIDDGPWPVNLRLDMPSAAHAGLEPRCAVARFSDDGSLEVWCGTQDPFFVRDVLARDHGLPPERVTVHAMRLGGAFGGRTIATVEREAAWVAQAIGVPVKLQWNRDDEFSGGFHRPPASHRIRARLDERGRISDWWHVLSGSHVLFTNAAVPPWMQRLTNLIGDDGTARGQHPPYAFARQRRSLVLTRLPIATGPWRGLGAGPNVLAIEAAMDEAARQAGADPVEFRLRHLAQAPAGEHLLHPERLAEVLRRAAAGRPRARRGLRRLQRAQRGRGGGRGGAGGRRHPRHAAVVQPRLRRDGRCRWRARAGRRQPGLVARAGSQRRAAHRRRAGRRRVVR